MSFTSKLVSSVANVSLAASTITVSAIAGDADATAQCVIGLVAGVAATALTFTLINAALAIVLWAWLAALIGIVLALIAGAVTTLAVTVHSGPAVQSTRSWFAARRAATQPVEA